MRSAPTLAACTLLLAAVGCGNSGGSSSVAVPKCAGVPPEEATSICLSPTQTPDFYATESSKYFDTLDSDIPEEVRPAYADLVVRWEWPPWLKLTGFGREPMIFTDRLLKLIPTKIPIRDCRFFPTQPFGRCYVVFDYSGEPCPIYEEFTFNDAGEMTFIEAWTDYPGYLPMADPADRWGEGPGVSRLSTRIPGLGTPEGRIDIESEAMRAAAERDPDVADFLAHARDPFISWLIDLIEAGPDLFDRGCDPGSFAGIAAREARD